VDNAQLLSALLPFQIGASSYYLTAVFWFTLSRVGDAAVCLVWSLSWPFATRCWA